MHHHTNMGQSPSSPTDSTAALQINHASTNHDLTSNLPDDCLSHIFHFLTAADRKRCSLVSKRWLLIDGQNRHRLSLSAKAEILPHLPSLLSRFDSVTKLALRCDRNSFSLTDEALSLISGHCSSLTRVKLRGCREVTDLGMEDFARNCGGSLKKLSCGSCDFGAKGLNAVLENCRVIEELSVKRLRGIHETSEAVRLSLSSSLKSVCLKELVNGQVFEGLVTSRTLKKVRIIRCLGNWDKVVGGEDDGGDSSSLVEIHLERLQVSDYGLFGISKCRKLETLHIVKTPECSDSGLVSVVERCGLLRKVHIDGWRTKRIGDEGLLALAKHCLLLQELVLIGVDATVVSLSAIGGNCKKLERLALCGSGMIGDAEMGCIGEKCVALRKFCIKGCPVSDVGIKAVALGCPNLVKLKVKKCVVVTGEVREWLRERRRTLVVSMDGDETKGLGIGSEDGGRGLETVVEEVMTPAADGGGDGEGGRLVMLKTRLLASKNFVASTLRRWLLSEANSST
ncbi:unnamed protein product [Eruca vesicaria subsp. sativa]|uniref:F-box domain-containing protein n=1 Tax=Eruca vesicaria subsp. sativa TaxID=29727 RepID=A0ABC8IX82_ERUVS|nr:unnamed protein product [Eruca vesicaria subsp. sativa]